MDKLELIGPENGLQKSQTSFDIETPGYDFYSLP